MMNPFMYEKYELKCFQNLDFGKKNYVVNPFVDFWMCDNEQLEYESMVWKFT